MMARTYVALTTQGHGHWVVHIGGSSKAELREVAQRQIHAWVNSGDMSPSDGDTATKNLIIMSISAARRAHPEAMRYYDYAQQAGIPY